MASNFYLSNFSANLVAQSLNTASTLGGGTLIVYTGTQPANANTGLSGNTALATFTLPAAGSNTVSLNQITVGAITNVTASASGTATWFRVTNGANTICDGTVAVSGADCNLNSVSISSGATVSITSFVLTVTE